MPGLVVFNENSRNILDKHLINLTNYLFQK
jgi:hypothetical protein